MSLRKQDLLVGWRISAVARLLSVAGGLQFILRYLISSLHQSTPPTFGTICLEMAKKRHLHKKAPTMPTAALPACPRRPP